MNSEQDLVDMVATEAAELPVDEYPPIACWHCGVLLIRDKWDVPRCETCPAPGDCDDDECEHCATRKKKRIRPSVARACLQLLGAAVAMGVAR